MHGLFRFGEGFVDFYRNMPSLKQLVMGSNGFTLRIVGFNQKNFEQLITQYYLFHDLSSRVYFYSSRYFLKQGLDNNHFRLAETTSFSNYSENNTAFIAQSPRFSVFLPIILWGFP
jgi:hypothetical protein